LAMLDFQSPTLKLTMFVTGAMAGSMCMGWRHQW
jgi:hypothetical protein